ncbi:MAG: MFS transporter, partial [Chloroflexi bacterium]|nr:MFS transporter [Chloroflexota bacterium]
IWTGQAFSLLGSSLARFALVWYLTKTTGSATVLASAALASLLPMLLLQPIAGALVDRWNRRIILIAADGLIALATAVLVISFTLGAVQLGHIYALMFFRALGEAFHSPAMMASTTLMVSEKSYSRIAGLNQTVQSAIGIASPLLGALLIETLPLSNILIIDVGTALLAIAPLFFISIPQPKSDEESSSKKSSILGDLREGVRFARRWRGFMALIGIIMIVNLTFAPAARLIPLLVTERFKGGALELAWLQAAISMGSLSGGLALSVWGNFRRRIVPSMLALALLGLSMAVIGLTPATIFPLAIGGVFCMGFTIAFGAGLRVAIIQTIVPPEMQGRIFTLLWSCGGAMAPLGLMIAGPVADILGAQFWFVACGIVTAVLGVSAFFIPAIMQIEAHKYPLPELT